MIKSITFNISIQNHSIDNLNLQWSDIENIHERIALLIHGYINCKTNDQFDDMSKNDIDKVYDITTIVS